MRIFGQIILILFMAFTNLFGDNYHSYILSDVYVKDSRIINPIDSNKATLLLIKNEFLKNGFTISLYDINTKKTIKSIYINNLYSLSEFYKDRLYILSTDGKSNFLISLEANLNNLKQVKLSNSNQLNTVNFNKFEVIDKVDDKLFIRLENDILKFNTRNSKIEKKFNLFEDDTLININDKIYLIRTNNTNAIIYNLSNDFELDYLSNVTIYDDFKIQADNKFLYFITSTENGNESLIQFIHQKTKKVESIQWVNSNINKIKIIKFNTQTYILNIENDNLHNTLYLQLINNGKIESKAKKYEIDRKFFGINNLNYINRAIILVFKNGLIQLDLDFNEISKDQFDTDLEIKWLDKFEDLLIFGDNQNTKFVIYHKNDWRYFNLVWGFLSRYGFMFILILIIIYLTLTIRHKRRFYNEILQHPALGCIYYLDSKGRLILSNNEGQSSLKLNNNIPLKRHFQFYVKNELNEKVSEFIKKTLNEHKNIKEKILITENGILKDWLINTFIIRNIAGLIKGVVVSVTDITEQLERQRLTNLASFAHDMQTNLSTIRLNAEQIECSDKFAQSKKKKILFQTNLLTQRVRDLLAVGRDDVLDLEEVIVDEIINKVYAEFDSEMYPEISFQSTGNIAKVVCDKNKIIRGIRNAVENSIKYLPEKKGIISINFYFTPNKQYYCFSIEDTGIGMDSDIKIKVLTPYFTTAKKTGGSGIGSMIMQKVAELHNGKIEIESEVNKGTKVKFYLPINYLKSLKNKMNRNDK